MRQRERKRKKIALFGHFDSSNFGNESTLLAILYHLRSFQPDAEFVCICTGPEATARTHHIEAIPISDRFAKSWVPRYPLTRALRRLFITIPSELYQGVIGLARLRHTDILVVPGTGLLTDAYGLQGWGPYNLFKWSVIAKVCGCKLLLIGVGAGPIYSAYSANSLLNQSFPWRTIDHIGTIQLSSALVASDSAPTMTEFILI